MQTSNEILKRYFWLIDTIYSAGSISLAEISRRWGDCSLNDTGEPYGRFAFRRDKEAILEIFGITIAYHRATNTYSIANLSDLSSGDIRNWTVQTFAVNSLLHLSGDMHRRIIAEQTPAGMRFLSPIVSAMKESRKLHLCYHRFGYAEAHEYDVAPYCLKVFKQRWYLVAKPDNHPEEKDPRVYALDRIERLDLTDRPFRLPASFDASRFFAGHFGIDRRIEEPEWIRIRVTAGLANYLRTLPLHHSQKEEVREADHSVFVFCVAPTYDFVQELRMHGSQLEVLSPQHLRDHFAQETASLHTLYHS